MNKNDVDVDRFETSADDKESTLERKPTGKPRKPEADEDDEDDEDEDGEHHVQYDDALLIHECDFHAPFLLHQIRQVCL